MRQKGRCKQSVQTTNVQDHLHMFTGRRGRPHPCGKTQVTLRTRQPPTGVSGPFGPEVPLGVSKRVSPKIGVCPKVSGEVPLGPF